MAAQVWLDRDDVAEVLARYQAPPLAGFVRSVRHKPRVSTREAHHAGWSVPGSLRCERWRRGYALLQGSGLVFELQAPWWHMGEALELARDFPTVPLVVNHAGLPAARDADSLARWRAAMERLAQAPNVSVKLSGLGVPGQPWTAELQAPVVNTLIDTFGVRRCLFASNFPVDGLLVSLDTLWSVFKQITRPHTPAERLALFCDNAVALYGLH
jgi:predicted TIM-barrel fold metal-dependent hydrolase